MSDPLVEVVIPVHRAERPVERALASFLTGTSGNDGSARAIVVCHNIGRDVFESRLARFGDSVRLIELHDGIPSPAGPLNCGLEAVEAPWATCMGSDDTYEPGAVTAWRDALESEDPDALILPVLDEATGHIDVPNTRHGRLQRLDLVEDLLAYRTGPLMLVRTDLVRSKGIRMTEGLRTGEDLAYSMHVWAQAARIDRLPLSSPKYVVRDDGSERVTRTPFAMSELLAPADMLAEEEWIRHSPERIRHAIAVRVVRRSILPALEAHLGDLSHEDLHAARATCRRWLELDPQLRRPLSVLEERAFTAVIREHPLDETTMRVARMRTGPRPLRLLPRCPWALAEPDTRLRHFLRGLMREHGR